MLQKIENYNSALAQLEQAVAIYQKSQQDALYRDGLIQRFEFTVELSWKSLKEYLEDQGFVLAASSPRAVLKDAYAASGRGVGVTYNENFFWFRIDNILHSANMKPINCTIDKVRYSDHYPMWCYLQLKEGD